MTHRFQMNRKQINRGYLLCERWRPQTLADFPNICLRKAFNYTCRLANGLAMPVTHATPFQCSTCGVEYKLVRVETKRNVPDQRLICRKCGSPLPGGAGGFVLKYFLSARRARGRADRPPFGQ